MRGKNPFPANKKTPKAKAFSAAVVFKTVLGKKGEEGTLTCYSVARVVANIFKDKKAAFLLT
jgi:hypothetical protein